MTTAKTRRRHPELFLNRETSWLEFNGRVLEEALDPSVPLLERLKFAAITASNLDEFFMVRVARLKQKIADRDSAADPAGLTPSQQLGLISIQAHALVDRLYGALLEEILPAMAQHGIGIARLAALDADARAQLARFFRSEVLPALTPLAIDTARPFPMLASLTLNLAILLEPPEPGSAPRLAVVQVPSRLPRLVRLAGGEGQTFVWLEEIIASEMAALFPGQRVLECAAFRLARDSELDLDPEAQESLLTEIEEELRKRRAQRVVRLEVEAPVGDVLLEILKHRLGVGPEDVFAIPGPLDVRALLPLAEVPALEGLRDQVLRPLPTVGLEGQEDIFEYLDDSDLLVHHPYDSFDPVAALVARAADDPDVLAIKQTLYRTTGDSPVVRALARAAEKGKQVTVVVELRARFDEQANIEWARRLEGAGAHVLYGIRGYKVHAKIVLIVRRGRDGIRRYVHLGTGNYNDRTARVYTDFGLMTSSPEIGQDASNFFNALTGYSDPPRMRKLVMAPTQLRQRVLELIRREQRRAEEGQPAEIRAKMNSLVDDEIIRALYEASRAGVKIGLNVRGICCLRPGLKGSSETIEVVSIVDRFLEHSRVLWLRNGGDEEVYLSSADWMPRNFNRRIELLFPVEGEEPRRRVIEALDAMFLDNVKSRWLQSDGSYRRRRVARGDEPFRAQIHLHREGKRALDRALAATGVSLEPVRSADDVS